MKHGKVKLRSDTKGASDWVATCIRARAFRSLLNRGFEYERISAFLIPAKNLEQVQRAIFSIAGDQANFILKAAGIPD